MNKKFVEHALMARLHKKASQSDSNFLIAAAAFSKNGNLLGYQFNRRNTLTPGSRRGAGIHAEASLIKRFGKKVDTIYLMRVGKLGDRLPIDPCCNCAKIAKGIGIKIVPLHKIYGCTHSKVKS